ncbi:MAG: long-chain-fatty-acid--CoA ligase [Rhizobiaceae bacterium]|nr:long-chain-fatty-acid--CoA ligase [Rhizobiaceae bacterium]
MLNTLGSFIAYNAENFPDKPAYIHPNGTLTFAQFNARVNQLINALTALGMKKGDRLGILSTNQLEMVEAYGAAEKGGFIAVPLNFRHQASDVEYVADNAELFALIVQDEYSHLVEGVTVANRFSFPGTGQETCSYERLLASSSAQEPEVLSEPDDMVYMMYTGGTTGRPKGVLLDHRGQIENAKSTMADAAFGSNDRLLTVMPLFHIGGKNFTTVHFHRACTNVLVPSFNAAGILTQLSEENITCVLLAPTMIKMLVDELDGRPFAAGCLKNVYYSSAPMPVSLLRQAIKAFGPVFMQFYGLTESGPSGACLRKEDHQPDGTQREQRRLMSAGRAMAYNEVRAVDDAGRALPRGDVGEICIRAEQVMRGYWRNEDATKETMIDGWIHSGDLGYVDEDGYIFVVGRKKDVIISGGENIYPREIEELLGHHPAIKEVAVIGVPDEKWGESVAAVVVVNDGHDLGADDVIEHCRQNLASYKKPRQVHFREALPRSSLGKIVKTELRDEFWAGHERKI